MALGRLLFQPTLQFSRKRATLWRHLLYNGWMILFILSFASSVSKNWKNVLDFSFEKPKYSVTVGIADADKV
jgi:hypothetical protein